MKGDFTRSTFRPQNGYTSVRMQQGRLQIDADWNEQADIMAYLHKSQALDMLGTAATPRTADQGAQADVFENFRLKPVEEGDQLKDAPGSKESILPKADLKIAPGHIYIDGVLCELSEPVTYLNQPYYADGKAVDLSHGDGLYLAYLDVWQRHITAIDDPQIREIALASVPDTATRLKTIWQVKLKALDISDSISLNAAKEILQQPKKGELQLRIDPARQQNNLANDQSVGNALYRIEIHESGAQDKATFKWSNNNGIVVSQVLQVLGDNTLEIDQQARDDAYKFSANDWVEIIDTAHELRGEPGLLVKLTDKTTDGKLVFDPATTISVESNHPVTLGDFKKRNNQNIFKVRRWEGIISGPTRNIIQKTSSRWIDLDDSALQVSFPKPESRDTEYATGDYWLIPMRFGIPYLEGLNSTSGKETVLSMPSEGIRHSRAPLALVKYEKHAATGQDIFTLAKTQEEVDRGTSDAETRGDFRITFPSLTRCLDSFGAVIQGSLEVQKNLLVTQSRDKDNNLEYGRLGVGTVKPQARVHVEIGDAPALEGDTTERRIGQIIKTAPNQTGDLQQWHGFKDNNPTITVIDSEGNLGLGLNAPDSRLAVRGQVKLFAENPPLASAQNFHSAIALITNNNYPNLTFSLNNLDPANNKQGQFSFNGGDLTVSGQVKLFEPGTTMVNDQLFNSAISLQTIDTDQQPTLKQLTFNLNNVDKNNNQVGQFTFNGSDLLVNQGDLLVNQTARATQALFGPLTTVTPEARLHVEISNNTHIGQIIKAASEQTGNFQEWRNSQNKALSLITANGHLALGRTKVDVPLAIQGSIKLFDKGAEDNDQAFYAQLVTDQSAKQLTFQLKKEDDSNSAILDGAIKPGFTFSGSSVTVKPPATDGKVEMDVQGLFKAQSLQLDAITITKFSHQFPQQPSADSSQTVPTEAAVQQYFTNSISGLSETLKSELTKSLTDSLTSSLETSLTNSLKPSLETSLTGSLGSQVNSAVQAALSTIEALVTDKADANGSLSNNFKANRLEVGNSFDTDSDVNTRPLSDHARLHVWGTNLSESIPGVILASRSQITSDVLQTGDSIRVDGDIKLVTGVTDNIVSGSAERTVTVNPPFAPDPNDPKDRAQFNYKKQSPIARFTDSNGKDQLTLTAQGNLMVGPLSETSQPPADAKLYVEGKVFGQQVEGEEITGTSVVQLSSQTLKENISALSEDEANVLLGQLDPVKFSYRNDENHQTHVGFIAETVPDIVASANHRGVSPLDVTAILTKVIQDHHQELDMMKAIIEQQQNAIQELTIKVEQLGGRRFRR